MFGEEDDLIDDEEDDEEEEPPPPPKEKVKRKKKTKKGSKKKIKKKSKLKSFQMAKESKKVSSGVGAVSNPESVVAPEVSNTAIEASEVPNELFKRSKEKIVKRRKYRVKCRECKTRFETKHDSQRYCRECLGDLSSGRR